MTHQDPELLASLNARTRTSPFFDRTVAAGLARVTEYNHMWLPQDYGDPSAEYERLTTAVAMWDVAAQRHIEVTGVGATGFVDAVVAIDATEVDPGTTTYAPMVDHDGRLINDPVLVRLPDGSWRLSIADGDIGLWLRAIAAERGLDVRVRELDTATLAVQGPSASAVASELRLDLDSLESRHVGGATIADDIDVWLSVTGWSGQDGFELFLDDPRHAERLWDAVADAGADHGIGPGTPDPVERMEAGPLLSYGTDSGYDADPFELGLGDVVDLDSGPFIGRDALVRIRDAGARRRLTGCTIGGGPLDGLIRPVRLGARDDVVEQLRAAGRSPAFDRVIGLCLVAAERDAGERFDVDTPHGHREVELVDLPFSDSLT
ncbi:glycine cleavage T C-terminal barrel domain-containing protein [Ilumatobacter sp.]|uniref:glycine cleavage T C-terminal barrel domain-containing protein n=1 Tax=Ilumatobacter sp. TaxID=1967498 RepID=UPI003B52A276